MRGWGHRDRGASQLARSKGIAKRSQNTLSRRPNTRPPGGQAHLRADYGWTDPIHITENMTDGRGPKPIPSRTTNASPYVSGFLEWISEAIRAGHDVRGHYLWSLMDKFEWSAGFSLKFRHAALDPRTLDRVPKKSAHWYRDLIAAYRATRSSPPSVDVSSTRGTSCAVP